MKKIYQTKFVAKHGTGNCLQAAVASILDLNLEDVPDFVNEHGDKWFEKMEEFIYKSGYSIQDGIEKESDYTLVFGDSPRGDFKHSVIYQNGKLAHDPHPDNSGVLSVYWSASVIKK